MIDKETIGIMVKSIMNTEGYTLEYRLSIVKELLEIMKGGIKNDRKNN